jgi:UDP-N-acetylglucosamine 4,6-dehydratase
MSSILITGGTGSLGRALVEKLINDDRYFRVVVFSRDEHKQAQMAEEYKSPKLRFFIGDVRDYDRLKLAMSGICEVVHAAALKVVPSGEYNPTEYIMTNVIGTMNVLRACALSGVPAVITVSTDKAVAPVNLYGATKLCAERLALAANNMFPGLNSSVVRYGNVANANGSIIPIFKRQYNNGDHFTLTDCRMTRFWIELDEAADFVMSSMYKADEKKVFVPSMPSFYIKDLADAFLGDKKRGLNHIKIIGIREGEKLHEQLDENTFSNRNDVWLNVRQLRQKLQELNVIGKSNRKLITKT